MNTSMPATVYLTFLGAASKEWTMLNGRVMHLHPVWWSDDLPVRLERVLKVNHRLHMLQVILHTAHIGILMVCDCEGVSNLDFLLQLCCADVGHSGGLLPYVAR